MKTGIVLLLAGLLMPLCARAGCVAERMASVVLGVDGGTLTVPVEVNGIVGTFVLDTGAQRSMVTEAAVRRLDLARDEWVSTTMGGVGGVERRPNADPRSLGLGGVKLVRRGVTGDISLAVGVLPRSSVGDVVLDGMLGRDFLSMFDLDLDAAGRRLTLYRVRGCGGRFLPWTGAYRAVPVTFVDEDALVVPVTLDGAKLRALLDTGASSSLVAAPGMVRLGLQPAGFASDPVARVSGVGPRMVTMFRHRFRSLLVGEEAVDSPVIWAAPVHLVPIVDMLVGADWVVGRRIWISYATQQLFVAAR